MSTGQLDIPAAIDAFGVQRTEFRNFVCWQPERVALIMDTEALQTPPEVFLATHSPLPMFRGDISDASTLRPYDENQFLADFLSTPDFSFVAVLGGAGTGKSHLIRWLSTRIPSTDRRRVLLIPRAGTNLHEVLRRVLEGIQGERFDEYRRRLTETSAAMSVTEARTRLLDNLAIAVEAGRQDEGSTVSDEDDYLSSELPHLLRDPVFRSHFLQPEGVLDRLAVHVIGTSAVERAEERRVFNAADLPSRFQDVNRASRLAQDIYRNLSGSDELREKAAAWLTRHLDEAVTQLMRMSGSDLLGLMIDVRAELARQGVELVLLIEDLATLQGIDQQLLEALIIRPRQEGMPELCALRTAVAMTSGYYEGLRKNVHQRFDFRVEMGTRDVRGSASAVDMERFTARYFNAARLSGAVLDGWYGQMRESDVGDDVPSACSRCPFRTPCHEAFGAWNGMGLYPLSSVAVRTISDRVSKDGFNPRTQLKEGYKPILENQAKALRDGLFPSPELGQRLGLGLPPLVMAELPRRDPANHARRAVLLDVWTTEHSLIDVEPLIHQAFDLPALGKGTRVKPDEVIVDDLETPEQKKLKARLAELADWSRGGSLSQPMMQDLRDLVYAAVVEHIDWNALHLLPGEFAGQKQAFRKGYSINFLRQVLPKARAPIDLFIPLPEQNIADVTVALQGLLLIQYHGSWKFENGGHYYRAHLRQVNDWARHVVSQVDQIPETETVWDPVPAAIELLAIGSRMFGLPRSRDAQRGQSIDAVFSDLPERDDTGRSARWQEVTRIVRRHQEKVREVVLARVACSKGDSRKIQIIDAARVLPPLVEVTRTFRPSESIPGDLRSNHFVREYREALDARLEQALEDERTFQLQRYDEVARQLGAIDAAPEDAAIRRRETIAAVRLALDAASSAGVLAGASKATLEERLSEFDTVQFAAWADSISRIRVAEERGPLLTELSLLPANTARVSLDVLEAMNRMFAATERSVGVEMGEGERMELHELEQTQQTIGGMLQALEDQVSAIAAWETQ